MALKKIVFKTRNSEGVDVELAVKHPSAAVQQKATMHRASTYGLMVANKVMMKQQLDAYLADVELWDDDKERQFQTLRSFILEGEMKLARGGIRKSEAYDVAKGLRGARAQVANLLFERRQIEQSNTADGLADQAKFEFLVAACTFYDEGRYEGKPYFTSDGEHSSHAIYLERSTEDDGRAAAQAFSDMFYGQVNDAPEEEFLAKYGYVDAKGRLVDKQGRFVDGLGRLIDAEGYFIDEAGDRVDADGNRVDDSGKYVADFVEFLDDEDAPSVEPEVAEPEVVATPEVEDAETPSADEADSE